MKMPFYKIETDPQQQNILNCTWRECREEYYLKEGHIVPLRVLEMFVIL
jgi:hypothetical protein